MTNPVSPDTEPRRRIANLAIQPVEISEPAVPSSTIWDDLGVTYLLRVVSRHRRLLWLFPILCLVFSNLGFMFSGRKYAAELQVVPAAMNNTLGHTNGLGAFGSLGMSALFGQVQQDDLFRVYLESWTAPWFAESIASNTLLMKRIFPEQWSDRVQDWREPVSLTRPVKEFVYPLFGARVTRWTPPSADSVLKYLQKNLTVQRTSKNVMARVTLRARNRALASDLLQYGHTLINRRTAEVLYQRATKSAEYLTQKLAEPSIADVRSALITELTTQERTKMLAFADSEFAAQSFGVFARPNPVTPKTSMVVGMAFSFSALAVLALMLLADRGLVQERRLTGALAWPARGVGRLLRRKRA